MFGEKQLLYIVIMLKNLWNLSTYSRAWYNNIVVTVFRSDCMPAAPALGGPLPFLTPEQFWPSIVFNPAAASAFLLGLPWHHHHHAAQPSATAAAASYHSSVHKALSERIITANQWPAAALQTSSSEPHSPSSAGSSSPAALSPAHRQLVDATTVTAESRSPDLNDHDHDHDLDHDHDDDDLNDNDDDDNDRCSPPVLMENVSC